MTPPGLRLAPALVALLAAGCNVFEDLGDCQKNTDCPLGQACNKDGKFCETDRGPIELGAVLPVEGLASDLAKELETSLELTTTVVNDAGGILGRPIRFKVMQDRPNEVTAASAHELIDQDRVLGIVGGTNSTVALILQELASPAKVLVISPMATSPQLSDAEPAHDRYFFRTMGVTRRGEAFAMASFVRTAPALCDKVYLIDDDSPFAQGYRLAFTEVFQKLGGCIAGAATVSTSVESSYGQAIAAMFATAPDCALPIVFADVGSELIRQTTKYEQDHAIDPASLQWLGGSPFHGTAFLELGTDDPQNPKVHVAEGTFISDADTTPNRPDYFRFRAMYNEHFGLPAEQDTPPNASNAYDAAVLLALAIERSGGATDRVAIRDGLWNVVDTASDHAVFGPDQVPEILRILRLLHGDNAGCGQGPFSTPCEIRYRGASSDLIFDERGTVSVPSAIFRLHDGAFVAAQDYDEKSYDEFDAMFADAPWDPEARCK